MEKKRCNNFTIDEIVQLVDLVKASKDIVECKKTDTLSNNTKDINWRLIEGRFNAVCGTGRTAKMLCSKWDSLKTSIKNEHVKQKQYMYKTGGGRTREIKLDGVGNRVLALIGVGAMALYYSDVVNTDLPVAKDTASLITEAFVEENIRQLEVLQTNYNWSLSNPQQLRQPKSKLLQISNYLGKHYSRNDLN